MRVHDLAQNSGGRSAAANCRGYDIGDRRIGIFADRKRFIDTAAIEDVDDALEEILAIDMRAPQFQQALEIDDHRRNRDKQKNIENQSAGKYHFKSPFI